MRPDDDAVAIEVRLFLEAIHEKYGYDLRDYAPASIRRRVLSCLAKSGLPHLGELQHRVLSDPTFFAGVLPDLTVQVTEMFRDPEFYRALRSRVIPVLRTYPLLRIWHSGCATGEEVYASAILLGEEGLHDRTQIYATDLSPPALEHAKQGVYSAEHLPSFAKNYDGAGGTSSFSDYYTRAYDGIAMREALRRNVLFFQHNLVSDHVFGEMHVIFCRNVLLYFDRHLKHRVLRKFTESLCPGGFLCLGRAERVPPSEGLALAEFDGEERIYRHEA